MASYQETLRDTILQNRKGAVFWNEYKQLRHEFDDASSQRIYYPHPMYDATTQRVGLVKEQYNHLFDEIRAHKTEKKPGMWTETYFKTEVQLLSDWASLMIRQYQELADAGMDTVDALEACKEFHEKIIVVVSRGATVGTTADRITDALCDVMGIR
jgi:hypothetical protein